MNILGFPVLLQRFDGTVEQLELDDQIHQIHKIWGCAGEEFVIDYKTVEDQERSIEEFNSSESTEEASIFMPYIMIKLMKLLYNDFKSVESIRNQFESFGDLAACHRFNITEENDIGFMMLFKEARVASLFMDKFDGSNLQCGTFSKKMVPAINSIAIINNLRRAHDIKHIIQTVPRRDIYDDDVFTKEIALPNPPRRAFAWIRYSDLVWDILTRQNGNCAAQLGHRLLPSDFLSNSCEVKMTITPKGNSDDECLEIDSMELDKLVESDGGLGYKFIKSLSTEKKLVYWVLYADLLEGLELNSSSSKYNVSLEVPNRFRETVIHPNVAYWEEKWNITLAKAEAIEVENDDEEPSEPKFIIDNFLIELAECHCWDLLIHYLALIVEKNNERSSKLLIFEEQTGDYSFIALITRMIDYGMPLDIWAKILDLFEKEEDVLEKLLRDADAIYTHPNSQEIISLAIRKTQYLSKSKRERICENYMETWVPIGDNKHMYEAFLDVLGMEKCFETFKNVHIKISYMMIKTWTSEIPSGEYIMNSNVEKSLILIVQLSTRTVIGLNEDRTNALNHILTILDPLRMSSTCLRDRSNLLLRFVTVPGISIPILRSVLNKIPDDVLIKLNEPKDPLRHKHIPAVEHLTVKLLDCYCIPDPINPLERVEFFKELSESYTIQKLTHIPTSEHIHHYVVMGVPEFYEDECAKWWSTVFEVPTEDDCLLIYSLGGDEVIRMTLPWVGSEIFDTASR
eukprot:TRINITY_DN510_c1_g2_i2.p1 TRINITY_DN510_c1_g2~~TRINITY_DN510_c1_g2_i2.p1  ORF type:complete len:741 (+),score=182.96 TRINITY_DN510_c1_g2_i2:50-2272(+)